MKHFPRPTGALQGDTRSMPDRGTGTGMTGKDSMTSGMSLDRDATNRIRGISGHTKSMPALENCPPGPDGKC